MTKRKSSDAPPAPPVPPAPAAPPEAAPVEPTQDQRVASLEQSVSSLANVMQAMVGQVQTMTGNMQHVLAALGAIKPEKEEPTFNPLQAVADDDWSEETYFVRIKPYNKQLGHLRRRQFVPELGRPINGGTGDVGDIPEWMPVSRDKAKSMVRYRQNNKDWDDSSPMVFDIATKAQMDYINTREDQQRMSNLGLAGMRPTDVLREADQGRLKAKIKSPKRGLPSTVRGSERYAPTSNVQPGRREALSGLMPEAPPAPPVPSAPADGLEPDSDDDYKPAPHIRHKAADVEDLSIDAARASLEDDMARVAALTEGHTEPLGRVLPK